MKQKIFLFSTLTTVGLFFSGVAKAVCPVCVVAVGAGLGFSEWLGVDDVVSSIWIGAFLVATVLWTLVWLKKRNWDFTFDVVVVSLAYYLLTFVPLYYAGIVGHPLNKFLGTDKIIFGSAVGSVIFLLADWLHNYLKKKNGGKSFFPYQKVVVPVITLTLTSLLFYIIITYKLI